MDERVKKVAADEAKAVKQMTTDAVTSKAWLVRCSLTNHPYSWTRTVKY